MLNITRTFEFYFSAFDPILFKITLFIKNKNTFVILFRVRDFVVCFITVSKQYDKNYLVKMSWQKQY